MSRQRNQISYIRFAHTLTLPFFGVVVDKIGRNMLKNKASGLFDVFGKETIGHIHNIAVCNKATIFMSKICSAL